MTNTSRDGIVRKMTVQFLFLIILNLNFTRILLTGKITRGAGGVLPYMGYIGMYRCEGKGFQAVYSRIGYINQSVWV